MLEISLLPDERAGLCVERGERLVGSADRHDDHAVEEEWAARVAAVGRRCAVLLDQIVRPGDATVGLVERKEFLAAPGGVDAIHGDERRRMRAGAFGIVDA